MNVVERRTVKPNPNAERYLSFLIGIDCSWPSQQAPLRNRKPVFHVVAQSRVRQYQPKYGYHRQEYNLGSFDTGAEAAGWRKAMMAIDEKLGSVFGFVFVVSDYRAPVYPEVIPWPESLISFDPMI